MFKSIEFLRYNNKSNSAIYKITDTDFECEVSILSRSTLRTSWGAHVEGAAREASAVAIEYQKRNISVIKNLFKCNLYLSYKYNCDFLSVLEWQKIYTNLFYKHINFSEIHYYKLKEMWNKHKVFL